MPVVHPNGRTAACPVTNAPSCCLTDTGFVPVDTYPAENMGDPLTLSSFLNYGFDFFPADSYSLILWDHGGGPVLGYGVDENFRDLLTLDELSEALEDSVGAHMTKLEWIGFDACLMSSLEVASVLAPYANYMIASQETEPGWAGITISCQICPMR